MLKIANAIFLFGFFKSNLSVKLYLSLCGSLVLLVIFSVYKESFHFYECCKHYCYARTDLIKLLYTVLVNTFDLYKEYNICLASFFNFSELFPACI